MENYLFKNKTKFFRKLLLNFWELFFEGFSINLKVCSVFQEKRLLGADVYGHKINKKNIEWFYLCANNFHDFFRTKFARELEMLISRVIISLRANAPLIERPGLFPGLLINKATFRVKIKSALYKQPPYNVEQKNYELFQLSKTYHFSGQIC